MMSPSVWAAGIWRNSMGSPPYQNVFFTGKNVSVGQSSVGREAACPVGALIRLRTFSCEMIPAPAPWNALPPPPPPPPPAAGGGGTTAPAGGATMIDLATFPLPPELSMSTLH